MAEYVCKNGILRPITHIYQCVDRLVEGVDYERFDWLKISGKSDNLPSSGIMLLEDVMIKSSWLRIIAKENSLSYNTVIARIVADKQYLLGFQRGGSVIKDSIRLYSSAELLITEIIDTNTKEATTFYFNTDGVYINDIKRKDLNITRCGFRFIQGGGKGYSINLSIKDIESNYYHLSPCQLLRPISAQLSTDNKPHPQGECGMVDSVSGKFFGNANTSSSFSVYND